MVPGDSAEALQRCGGYTYEQGELRGIVGEERKGNEMDGCPLTDGSIPSVRKPLELQGMLSIELLTFQTLKLWTILYEMSQHLNKTWP
jgi:hypothetical protein